MEGDVAATAEGLWAGLLSPSNMAVYFKDSGDALKTHYPHTVYAVQYLHTLHFNYPRVN